MSHKPQKQQFDAKRQPVEYEEGPIMNNTQAEPSVPETSIELILEWFNKAAQTAFAQGNGDSAQLWKDGIQHLKYYNATVSSQRAEIERLRVDAERYRFLRDGEWRDTALEPVIRLQLNELWDEKIDAARTTLNRSK